MIRTLMHGLFLAFLSVYSAFSLAADAPLKVVYTYAKDSFGEVLQNFAREKGVSIEVEFREQNDLKSSIMGMLELGTTPDAIVMPADHVGLHGFVKYSEVNPADFSPRISPRIWASAVSHGVHYGVPFIQGNHLMMYYNKTLVDKPAQTWDELFEQRPLLNEKGLSVIAWSFDEPYWFLPFLGAYGGWPLDSQGKVSLSTPEMAAALEFYKSLRVRELPYPNCNYRCGVDLFKTEKMAYTINGDWIGKEFYQALGDKLGVTAIPMAEGHKMVPTFTSHILAFPNDGLNGPRKAQLMSLAQYLLSPKVQQQLWDRTGAVPVDESVFNDVQEHAEGYLKSTLELMKQTKPLPTEKEMTFLWDAIGKGFLRHREGALTAPAAAKYMQQLAERHIRNAERLAAPPPPQP